MTYKGRAGTSELIKLSIKRKAKSCYRRVGCVPLVTSLVDFIIGRTYRIVNREVTKCATRERIGARIARENQFNGSDAVFFASIMQVYKIFQDYNHLNQFSLIVKYNFI